MKRLVPSLLAFAAVVHFAGAQAPEPLSGDYDWVQLKSGEWLKGEIKELQDDSFTFDSDILDDLEIDWDDVEQLHSQETNTLGLADGGTAMGSIVIDSSTVTVSNQAGSKEIKRSELRSIIPGGRQEMDFWTVKANAGGSFRSGNVEQSDFTVGLSVQRRTPATRLRFNYDGTQSNVSGTETANSARVTTSFDYYMTPRLFLQIPSIEYTRDRFQNIEHRITPGLGLGYDVIDRGPVEWDLSTGLGYQYTEFFSVSPGEPTTEETAALFLGTVVDWEATDYLDVLYSHSITMPVPDNENFISNANLGLSIELTGRLDLDFNFIWDYVNNPTANSTGLLPEKSDFRSTISLGWEL
jgi:putative salt-induced outer membrane protein YdiY